MPEKQLTMFVNGKYVVVDEWIYLNKPVELVSFEELLESGHSFHSEGDSVEETVTHNISMDEVHQAVQILPYNERVLIEALFFSNEGDGMSVKRYAEVSGIPRTSVRRLKDMIMDKLRNYIVKFGHLDN